MPQSQEVAAMSTWEPTHVSRSDGSPAQYTGFGEPPTEGYILLANENGDEWIDSVDDWEQMGRG